MILATLLATIAADAGSDKRSRARANELKGRLGVGQQARASGPAARIAFACKHHNLSDTARAEIVSLLRRANISTSGPPSRTDKLIPWYVLQYSRIGTRKSSDRDDQLIREVGAIRMVRDWYLSTGANLMSLTMEDAYDDAVAFHTSEYASDKGGQSVPPGVVVYDYGDGWTVHRLTYQEMDVIRAEGESMQNCLSADEYGEGHYDDEIERGELVIYSLRGPPNPDGSSRPRVTMAYSNGMVEASSAYDVSEVDEDKLWDLAEYLEKEDELHDDFELMPDEDGDFFIEYDRETIELDADEAEDHVLDNGNLSLYALEDIVSEKLGVSPDRRKLHAENGRVEDISDFIDQNAHQSDILEWSQQNLFDEDRVGFPEIKGRQNDAPAERYRRRISEFLLHFSVQIGIPVEVFVKNYPSETLRAVPGDSEVLQRYLRSRRGNDLYQAMNSMRSARELMPPALIEELWEREKGDMGLSEAVNFTTRWRKKPDEDVRRRLDEALAEESVSACELRAMNTYMVVDDDFAASAKATMRRKISELPVGPDHATLAEADIEQRLSAIMDRLIGFGLFSVSGLGAHSHVDRYNINGVNYYLNRDDPILVGPDGEARLREAAAVAGLSRDGAFISISTLACLADPSLAAELQQMREALKPYSALSLGFAIRIDNAVHPTTVAGAADGKKCSVIGSTMLVENPTAREPMYLHYFRKVAVPSGESGLDAYAAAFKGTRIAENSISTVHNFSKELGSGPSHRSRRFICQLGAEAALWYALYVDCAPHPMTRTAACGGELGPACAVDYAARVDQAVHPMTRAAVMRSHNAAGVYLRMMGYDEQVAAAAGSSDDRFREGGSDLNQRYVGRYQALGFQDEKRCGLTADVGPYRVTDPGVVEEMLSGVVAAGQQGGHAAMSSIALSRVKELLQAAVGAQRAALAYVLSRGMPPTSLASMTIFGGSSPTDDGLRMSGEWIWIPRVQSLKYDVRDNRTVRFEIYPLVRIPMWFILDRIAYDRVADIAPLSVPPVEGSPDTIERRDSARPNMLASQQRALSLFQINDEPPYFNRTKMSSGSMKEKFRTRCPATPAQVEAFYGWMQTSHPSILQGGAMFGEGPALTQIFRNNFSEAGAHSSASSRHSMPLLLDISDQVRDPQTGQRPCLFGVFVSPAYPIGMAAREAIMKLRILDIAGFWDLGYFVQGFNEPNDFDVRYMIKSMERIIEGIPEAVEAGQLFTHKAEPLQHILEEAIAQLKDLDVDR